MSASTTGEVTAIEAFVRPFYEGKDTMHDLSHIRRVLRGAHRLVESLTQHADAQHADATVLVYAAYLHGLIYEEDLPLRAFLEARGLAPQTIQRIVQAAQESQKDERPESLEGTILHDAHLIEGGRTFVIVKSLVTGSCRGQTLNDTLAFIENNVLGRFTCYLPEAQALYAEKEAFARAFLADLKPAL